MTCSKCQAELPAGSIASEMGVDLCPLCYREQLTYLIRSPAAVEKLVAEVKKELGLVFAIFGICSMSVYIAGHWQSLHRDGPQRPQSAPAGQIQYIHNDLFVNNVQIPETGCYRSTFRQERMRLQSH